MRLSLCIITFNEENNIHFPLESAYDLADEVIIVDGGSTDKTVEKAKKYGSKVKVLEVDNPKNFLENKKRAIEKANGEWILQLDADEALSGKLHEEIKEVLGNATSAGVSGYRIPRKNWFLGRFLVKGGVYPDYVLRLYRREGSDFELKDLHENVKVPGKIETLKHAIEHYADPDFERYLTRWNRYTTFDAELLAKEKGNLNFLDFLNYFVVKPKVWFLMTYFRHKGFMDGFPGFIFSLFSALRFLVIYVKAWNILKKNGK